LVEHGLLSGHCLLGLETGLEWHLLVQKLLRLHVWHHLGHLVEGLLHHLLHHWVLLLQHELLCLQLLLLILVHQLFVVVVHIVALLLRDCDVRVLLQDLGKLVHFHVLI
jgi:hypothetical protein